MLCLFEVCEGRGGEGGREWRRMLRRELACVLEHVSELSD
jgi:hypothetical protein